MPVITDNATITQAEARKQTHALELKQPLLGRTILRDAESISGPPSSRVIPAEKGDLRNTIDSKHLLNLIKGQLSGGPVLRYGCENVASTGEPLPITVENEASNALFHDNYPGKPNSIQEKPITAEHPLYSLYQAAEKQAREVGLSLTLSEGHDLPQLVNVLTTLRDKGCDCRGIKLRMSKVGNAFIQSIAAKHRLHNLNAVNVPWGLTTFIKGSADWKSQPADPEYALNTLCFIMKNMVERDDQHLVEALLHMAFTPAQKAVAILVHPYAAKGPEQFNAILLAKHMLSGQAFSEAYGDQAEAVRALFKHCSAPKSELINREMLN